MFSTLFKPKPVIDEESKEWIFDTFAWCIDQLDSQFFKDNSKLILPNNTFYPGSSSSVEEMAETIFANSLKYTGMTSWPIKLIPVQGFIPKPMPRLSFKSTLRGESCKISSTVSYKVDNQEVIPTIDIPFHPSQLNQPQDLIAYLVQRQAGILVNQNGANTSANTSGMMISGAPGGSEVLAQTIDLVACFMGFGVIFANTAYQFKGGCGSCNNSNLNRQGALPELETVYALALFCVIKGADIKPIKKELKSHLYKPFRQAHKEITLYLRQTTNPTHALLNH
jgi:hypothetical protein